MLYYLASVSIVLVLLSLLTSEKIAHITAVVLDCNEKPDGDPASGFFQLVRSVFVVVVLNSHHDRRTDPSEGSRRTHALPPPNTTSFCGRERDGSGRSEIALTPLSDTPLLPNDPSSVSDLGVVVTLRPIVRIRVTNRSIVYEENTRCTRTYDTVVWPFAGGCRSSIFIRIRIQANTNYGEAWTVSSSWWYGCTREVGRVVCVS